ncbi:MAG: flagellar biosynthesis protein FliQ [Actinomycetota bacterium]
MTDTAVIDIALQTMLIATKLAAPVLLTALAVGFGVSLFQSVTQIQEVTLSFVPKMVAVGAAILVAGNWMLHEMISFTQQLFAQVPSLLGSG